MLRALRILAVALTTAGLVILLDAGLTLAWKEPASALYGEIQQSRAADQLSEIESEFLATEEVDRIRDDLAGSRGEVERAAARLAGAYADTLEKGKPIGKIRVPSMGVEDVVLEGTDTATLKKGPGRYPETKLPGQGGTVGIAGHRTTYGAPFKDIDDVEEGDEVEVEMPYATFRYEVTKTRIVEPTRTAIVRDLGVERIVLTACHPLYSAAERYAVFADLASIELAEPLAERRT